MTITITIPVTREEAQAAMRMMKFYKDKTPEHSIAKKVSKAFVITNPTKSRIPKGK